MCSNLSHQATFLQDSLNAKFSDLDSIFCAIKNLGLSLQRLSERFCEKNLELERLQIIVLMTQFAPSGKSILSYKIGAVAEKSM